MNYLDLIAKMQVKVESVSGECIFGYKNGDLFLGNQLTPGGICPYLYNNLIPYRLTFENGGYFKWRRDKHSVEVLCPNPEGLVNIKVKRQYTERKPNIVYEVCSLGGECIAGYKKGDRLNPARKKGLCPSAYSLLFPELISCIKGEQDYAQVSCPSSRGTVMFTISKR